MGRKIKEGDIFYHLKVRKNLGYRIFCSKNTTYFECECLKCGNIIDVPMRYLGRNKKDCGCGRHDPRRIIKNGEKFGKLTVIENLGRKGDRGYHYLCECECGRQKEVLGQHLTSGETRSCGCLHDELFKKNVKKAYEKNFVEGTALNKIAKMTIQKNNTSGVRGVSWHKAQNKWNARIFFKGKSYSLGYYDRIEDAKQAREEAEKELFGNFLDWYKQTYSERRKAKEDREKKKKEREKEHE